MLDSNRSLTTLVRIEIPHSGIWATGPKQYAHDANESAHDEAHQGPDQLRDPETYGSLVSLASSELRGSPRSGVRTLDHSPEEEQHVDLEGPDENDVGRYTGAEPFRNPNVRLGLVDRHGLPLGKREDM